MDIVNEVVADFFTQNNLPTEWKDICIDNICKKLNCKNIIKPKTNLNVFAAGIVYLFSKQNEYCDPQDSRLICEKIMKEFDVTKSQINTQYQKFKTLFNIHTIDPDTCCNRVPCIDKN